MSSSGAKFTSWQAAWLKALVYTTEQGVSSSTSTSSSSSSSAAQGDGEGGDLAVPGMLPPAGYSSWYGEPAAGSTAAAAAAASATGGGSATAEPRVSCQQLGMSEERLWAAIVLNCYGEGFQDLPATLCSGAPVGSQLGLWGPFALLNHSCCPNAVNYTLRDSMVVRAAAALPAGAELCINYLGRGALRPLSQRQLELDACYGFKCNCDRCSVEAAAADVAAAATGQTATLGQLLDSLHTAIGGQYEPRLQALMSQGQEDAADASKEGRRQQPQEVRGGLVNLAAEMQQQWEDLQSACVSASSSSSSSGGGSSSAALLQAWSEGSAFDLLGLLQEALAAAGEPDAHVLDAMLHVCQALCPGSDLHVFHALRRASVEQQSKGEASQEAAAAFGKLAGALHVRYGQQVVEDEELLSAMVAASSRAVAMVAF
ncbi:hypothetical protein COO60DRAFT_370678 [Scenedesmus sp. NREL 46B-D3]|nr:hypothetical protein COO60DRAFT_370678 [Scenedesmus sp. NREL 46B-D3]